MSNKESTFLNMLVTLVVVTGVAAFSLGFVYKYTKEPIAIAKAEKQLRAIKAVVGDYDNDPLAESYKVCKTEEGFERCEEKDGLSIYPATLNNALSATGVQTFSDKGYSGRIELMVGIGKDGAIKNIEVVSHSETPGLGSKMKEAFFRDQFIGRSKTDAPLKVKKDGGDVDALSGATISSRAFCEAVQQAMKAYDN